ncbi:hypothetical protein L7F22_010132 [Adiantum nelumboides]|nr:hypothetical protein [Adiantum nelumboides]
MWWPQAYGVISNTHKLNGLEGVEDIDPLVLTRFESMFLVSWKCASDLLLHASMYVLKMMTLDIQGQCILKLPMQRHLLPCHWPEFQHQPYKLSRLWSSLLLHPKHLLSLSNFIPVMDSIIICGRSTCVHQDPVRLGAQTVDAYMRAGVTSVSKNHPLVRGS